jgi:hypothetical protein
MHIAYDACCDQVKVDLLPDAPVASVREVNGIVLRYGPDRRVIGIAMNRGRKRIDATLLDLAEAVESGTAHSGQRRSAEDANRGQEGILDLENPVL